MTLTQEEIERYAPYHEWPEFEAGFNDYNEGLRRKYDGVQGQAYDRGAECAMRRGLLKSPQTTSLLNTMRKLRAL